MNHAGPIAFGLVGSAALAAIAVAMIWVFLEHAHKRTEDWWFVWLLWCLLIIACTVGSMAILGDVFRRLRGPIL